MSARDVLPPLGGRGVGIPLLLAYSGIKMVCGLLYGLAVATAVSVVSVAFKQKQDTH